MFDSLQDQLQEVFDDLKGKGRLSEGDISAAMRRVRMALLEADVSFKVVKPFITRTSARCMEADVLESLTPAQNVVKVVLDELTALRLNRSGENVPTFLQFCEVYRGRDDVDVEIEMKEHGDEMTPERLDLYIKLLHDEAIAGGLVPGTYAFTSFSVPTLKRFRELYPDARLGLICIELSEANIAQAAALGCMRIAPQWNQSGPMSVAKAHMAGLSVNLWCSDSAEIYETVKEWGSDVSTSNIPRVIARYARESQGVE